MHKSEVSVAFQCHVKSLTLLIFLGKLRGALQDTQ